MQADDTIDTRRTGGLAKATVGPDGKRYLSISAMCRAYGVSYASYTVKKSKGYTMAQALGIEKIPDRNSHPVTGPDGKKYPSMVAVCRVYGAQPATVSRRLSEGWTLEDALTVEPYGKKVYAGKDGVVYSTKTEMYAALGLSRSAYHERIKHGWTEEEALTIPAGGHRKRVTTLDGRTFVSVKEMCKAYGVDYRVYKYRIRKGMSPEEALAARSEHTSKEAGGKVYDTVKDMCNAYGITTGVFYGRISRGMTQEEALTADTGHRNPKEVTGPDGRQYQSVEKMCKAYGIGRQVYESRRRMGWPLEKSLTEPVRHRVKNRQK